MTLPILPYEVIIPYKYPVEEILTTIRITEVTKLIDWALAFIIATLIQVFTSKYDYKEFWLF